MRWQSILSEAWRNLVTGTALAAPLSLLVGAVCGILVGIDLGATSAISIAGQQFQQAAANVMGYQAPGRISAVACEALNSSKGVEAGAIRRAPKDLVLSALPSSGVPTYEVTSGFPHVLYDGRHPIGGGLLVSRALADAIGLEEGETLSTLHGDAEVALIYDYPDDGRRPDLEYAILVPVVAETAFDECWARTWPQSDALVVLLRTTILPGNATEDSPNLLQVNQSLGNEFLGEERFADRPTRFLPLIGAALVFLLAFFGTRLRRVELAAARHSGMRLKDVWAMLVVETLGWIAVVVVIQLPLATWFVAQAASVDKATYIDLAARYCLMFGLFALSGASVGAAMIRERQLFVHFKARK